MKYSFFKIIILTLSGGQCVLGSLTGAVASKKVTEASKGQLTPDGNRSGPTKR